MYSVVCHHISVTKEKGITLEDGDDDSDDDGGEENGDDDEDQETVDRIIFSSFLQNRLQWTTYHTPIITLQCVLILK